MASFTQCDTDAGVLGTIPRVAASAAYPDGSPARVSVIERWFATTQPYRRVTTGNQVVSYVYGICAFADIASAIKSTNLDQHQICLIGWWIDPGTLLFNVPGSSLLTYLSNSKARILDR